ncbi:MAG: 7-carboxy-7-deazaguanine synthase [Pseudomonadota bacterium]|uniref:7-carboxy-7-deazaguanine synthase n=1 Tax=Sphingobium xenophagum TaxID=121428 RepID=A0A249MQB7_SPHXE|nr:MULTISPECIES: 7-carboxy-7-deazaguanine synthase [Sphingobium]ASY43541.1 7-carboxy-7-deazaguanine synthase [Sphingobium xenophagum]OUC55511.1 7-carboxy-7-deazaguanine synthase [Sphingobium sp. GW456-12-10-14-TSB1]QWT13331.1 7-carboxy-7-deazaguanine synthase [Sphingobium xenophagum]|tara:strand:- start:3050 stop:3697 length:648 start_codon:yes stop_codon:yes gene_type:complete
MSYAVKEMFLTLQGEGVQAGRRAVFLRFAGCNLWSGREQDRAQAICRFCDTDFVGTDGDGGGKFADADALADAALAFWCAGDAGRYIVLTGGEPMLQVDDALVDALHARGFTIAIESNGTLAVHPGIDWICISPKAGSDVVQREGHELKLVWPQPGGGHSIADVAAMEQWAFAHHLLQPLDDPHAQDNARAAIALVMDRPRWRLTVQAHKYLGLR